jgi:ABC-2 type transport system permease protein
VVSAAERAGFELVDLAVVLINPLIYVAEGMRAGLTSFSHLHLYIIYPVLLGFCGAFLWLGLRSFGRRVLV